MGCSWTRPGDLNSKRFLQWCKILDSMPSFGTVLYCAKTKSYSLDVCARLLPNQIFPTIIATDVVFMSYTLVIRTTHLYVAKQKLNE